MSELSELEEGRINNPDIRPNPQYLVSYGEVGKVLNNKTIEAEFDRYENVANAIKKRYQSAGTIALILLIAALIYATVRLTVAHPPITGLAMKIWESAWAVIGIAPLCLWWWFRKNRLRDRWIENRYKAERIRHYKYHEFFDGEYMASVTRAEKAEDANEFNTHWSRFASNLEKDLDNPETFLNEPFAPAFSIKAYPPELWEHAYNAYYDLRIKVRKGWFLWAVRNLKKINGPLELWANILFGLAAVVGATDLIFQAGLPQRLLQMNSGSEEPILRSGSLVAVIIALISAGIRVYQTGAGTPELIELYQGKADLITILEGLYRDAEGHPERCQKIMLEVEKVCSEELNGFLRIARKSDFLL